MAFADYIGRTVDLRIFTHLPNTETDLLTSAIGGTNGSGDIHTGVYKLAQKYLMLLQTTKGSVKYFPHYGCSFWNKLLNGYLRTVLDVRQAFLSADSEIGTQLKADELASTPADERYASATISGISVTAGSATMTVEIFSQAGTARTVIVPLSTSL